MCVRRALLTRTGAGVAGICAGCAICALYLTRRGAGLAHGARLTLVRRRVVERAGLQVTHHTSHVTHHTTHITITLTHHWHIPSLKYHTSQHNHSRNTFDHMRVDTTLHDTTRRRNTLSMARMMHRMLHELHVVTCGNSVTLHVLYDT